MRIFLSLLVISCLILGFNNCSKIVAVKGSTERSSLTSRGHEGGEVSTDENINKFKKPRPETLCGQDGFDYLYREYIEENCIGCHSKSGFAPRALAAKDTVLARSETLGVSKEKYLKAVSKNSLCLNCNLDTNGEVYQAIEEWLDERSCL